MKILNHPFFWREKTMIIGSGITSVVAALLPFFMACLLMWCLSLQITNFWLVFLTGWFLCVTYDQMSAFRIDDIEAIAASPLGIKDFAKGRAVFSECKSLLGTVLLVPFLYYDKLPQIFSPNLLDIAALLAAPFFIYHWALFFNMVSFFISDRLVKIIPTFLSLPAILIPILAPEIFKGQVRDIIQISVVPAFGTLAFIANMLFFKFMPKEAIRSQALTK